MNSPLCLAFLLLLSFPSSVAAGFGCSLCHHVVSFAHDLTTSNFTINAASNTLFFLCKLIQPEYFCHDLFFHGIPLVAVNLFALFNPPVLCADLGFCETPVIVTDSNLKYRNEKLLNKPPARLSRSQAFSPYPRANFSVLVMNDPHIDFDYQQGTLGNCLSMICCRKVTNSTFTFGTPEYAGKWGYVGQCDLPVWTLDSFFDVTFAEHKPDIIVLLGDNIDHGLWREDPEEHLKPGRYIVERLNRTEYREMGRVYPVLGNHEARPLSQYDSSRIKSNQSQWVMDAYYDMWKHWLTPESYMSMKKYGRYTQLHPNSNLRIVALNSFVYDAENSFIWVNTTDPTNELAWLEDVLLRSERAGELVYIIGHIPPQHITAIKEWAYRYTVLVERFSATIKGQFFGHTHQDNFLLMKSKRDQHTVVGVAYVMPPLTTYGVNNPSFRIFYSSTRTFEILNYVQYRLYLDRANKNETAANWEVAYRFTDMYGVPDMSFRSFEQIDYKLQTDLELWRKMVIMHYSEGPKSKNLKETALERRYYYCYVTSGSFYELEQCTGGVYNNVVSQIAYGFAIKQLLPGWRYVTNSNQKRE